jgi:hypothetical protein
MASWKMAYGLFPDKWTCIDDPVEAVGGLRQIAERQSNPDRVEAQVMGRESVQPKGRWALEGCGKSRCVLRTAEV